MRINSVLYFNALISILLITINTSLKLDNIDIRIFEIIIISIIILPDFIRKVKKKLLWIMIFQLLISIVISYYYNINIEKNIIYSLHFVDIVIFLLFMNLYSVIFKETNIKKIFLQLLYRVNIRLRKATLLTIAIISGFGLSLGTSLVLSQIFEKKDYFITALLSRAIILSMMLFPVTATTATLIVIYSDLSIFSIVVTILPIFLMGFLANFYLNKNTISLPKNIDTIKEKKVNLLPFAISFITVITLIYFSIPILLALCWGAIIGFLSLERGKRNIKKLGVYLTKSMGLLKSEMSLFLITGLLVGNISNLQLQMHYNIPENLQIYIVPPTLVAIFICTALLSLHPMVVFGFIYPLSISFINAIPHNLLYCIWTVCFAVSLLMSPVSIISITSSMCSGLSVINCSYKMHWRFVAILSISMIMYIYLYSYFFL
ncbi:unnamed protein product [Commensalibacter communis]|uniref:hypothetical protein n=1 Tax=Commensalibacter communis TaxID=2972786 RepID=UPI0022FFA939|nr:hypothetical protein [Commensalibacter communis]CAI3922744.1 unnamed protein product [Commensalibacter communis]CAI3936783.1 unnamed protein product [Commensalibacter communis]